MIDTKIEKVTGRAAVIKMTLLFMTLYTVSYLTRINYGAVISEIVKAEGIDKSSAALALTASAVTYGLGQLVSGYLGDKLNPKKLIMYGLLVTLSMNLVIPLLHSAGAMSAAWGINGIAQAFMWPPLVRIMITVFKTEDYKRACLVVSCAASLGTMIVYAICRKRDVGRLVGSNGGSIIRLDARRKLDYDINDTAAF